MKYLFLMVFLVSCQTSTRIFQGERCQTFFKFDDAQRIILEESVCRCTNYKISMEFIGNTSTLVTRHPIEYCHEKIGFSVKENNTLVNFYKDVRDDIKGSQKKKREKTNY